MSGHAKYVASTKSSKMVAFLKALSLYHPTTEPSANLLVLFVLL